MTFLAGIAAVAVAATAPSVPVERAQLVRARTVWSAQHVADYRFRLRIDCDCAARGRVTITVRGGRPHGSRAFAGQLQTFPEMFRLIGQVVNDPAAEGVKVRYDPRRGFPRTARLDALSWTVDHFQPL